MHIKGYYFTSYKTEHLKQLIKKKGHIMTLFSHFYAGCSPSNKTHWTCNKELMIHQRFMSSLNCTILFEICALLGHYAASSGNPLV